MAEALEESSVRPIIPACEEIASWASILLPTIDEIREVYPDTEPILRKVAAIADATWTAEQRLPLEREKGGRGTLVSW